VGRRELESATGDVSPSPQRIHFLSSFPTLFGAMAVASDGRSAS